MTSRFIDHLLSGVVASRPAASAVPTGTLYCGTDTGLIYQTNGTAWSTWATLGSTPLTTKGDLFGFDTAGNRIPVGTNGQVLTADSTQALGVKWAAAGGGSSATVYARLAATASQSSPGAVWTTLTLGLVAESNTGSVSASVFTVPTAKGGVYSVSFGGNLTAAGGFFRLNINGTGTYGRVTSGGSDVASNRILQLAAGDTVKVELYNSATGYISPDVKCYMEIVQVQ